MGRKSRSKTVQNGYSRLFKGGQLADTLQSLASNDIVIGTVNGKSLNTEGEILDYFREHINSELSPAQLYVFQILQYVLYKKQYKTFYITTPELVDFLENQKINSKDQHIVDELIVENVPDCSHSMSNLFEGSFRIAVIHFINRQYSLMLLYSITEHQKKYLTWGINSQKGILTGNYPLINNSDLMNFSDNDTAKKVWKTIYNLFLYINTFPEAIKDGPPPIRMEESEKRLHSTSIGSSEVIKRMYVNGITPHMRRGHYRVFRNEKFTHKRFQSVYIEPTMVKGKAVHIDNSL